jgi:hypothetical protein
MTVRAPFAPRFGAGLTVTASTTSQTEAIARDSKSIRICNLGTNLIYVRTCWSGDPVTPNQTATAADTPVLAGTALILSKPEAHDTLAFIAATSTSSMHAQPGEGGQ